MRRRRIWIGWTVLAAALITAPGAYAAQLINGAGATFPYPIYSKWFDEFHKKYPDAAINYQSIGSGGGIPQGLGSTGGFGARGRPMADRQLAPAKRPPLPPPTLLAPP